MMLLALAVFLRLGCPGCVMFIGALFNETGQGIVCRVHAPPTETAFDVAVCPGQKLRNYHWRGSLYCSNLPPERMPRCGGNEDPGSLPNI